MAEPRIEIGADGDVEMAASMETPVEVESAEAVEDGAEAAGADGEEVGAPTSDNKESTFVEFLKSPIVELVVGRGDEQTTVTAHQAILTASPFFKDAISHFTNDGPRRIILEDEMLDTIGCFLQYQYTGEYFPRRLVAPSDALETHPSIPAIDDSGEQLLKHARIYTLAEKLGLQKLKQLAHSKIHRINSTARGEIAYARYVYGNTPADDTVIRKPVAAFWATRSHVLRHEAEQEFKTMCLEYPQFGFDVLSLVLDQKEKRSHDREAETPAKGSARKRARTQL
ncbi:BTB superfamily domain-containing protein [Histoplasma ohiense]|nr:BTB superfamily domain-containing protein [Histoplasma ohiense (nom. inval.)]